MRAAIAGAVTAESARHVVALHTTPGSAAPAKWADFEGQTVLLSDGASGSYVTADATSAARLFFGDAGGPVGTMQAWVLAEANGFAWSVSDDGAPRLALVLDEDLVAGDVADALVTDAAGTGDAEVTDTVLSGGRSWDHVVMRVNRTTLELFVNGVSVGTDALPATFATVDALTFFADHAHANRLAGAMCGLAIWDAVLSAAEIVDLYNSGPNWSLQELGTGGVYNGMTRPPDHWWPCDGDSGSAVTDRGSAGDCDLTLHGGVTFEPFLNWYGFAGTHYMSSDGTSGSYADAATSALAQLLLPPGGKFTVTPWTVSAWVRPTTQASPQWIFNARSGAAQAAFYWAGTDGDDGIFANIYDGANGANPLAGNPTLVANQDHLATLVNDAAADTLRLYVDGVSVATASTALAVAALPASVDGLWLFDSGPLGGEPLTGRIRNLAFWSRALSAPQVAALNTGGVTFDTRTVAGGGPDHWYPCDGDSGTTVTDRGAVGFCDLTLHGGVSIV